MGTIKSALNQDANEVETNTLRCKPSSLLPRIMKKRVFV